MSTSAALNTSLDVDNVNADDFDFEPPPLLGTYRSPAMRRLGGQGNLTLEMLKADVPLFQAGRDAQVRLDAGDHTARERTALIQAQRVGESAKDRLVMAAIPLIKHVAQREFLRRQQWQSQVTFDDLFQEGIYGLMRGLRKYDANGNHKSATNYLGQWVLTMMKREVEEIDNDFGVAFDAAERFRRIRALRSRLAANLGRLPTDEEIIEASTDGAFSGGQKMGRVKADDAPAPKGKLLTAAHLADEQGFRLRVGLTSRLSFGGEEDNGTAPLLDWAKPIDAADDPDDTTDRVVLQGAQSGLAKLIRATLDAMGLPANQRAIIARRYGLPPHDDEQSARDISVDLDLHREKVGKVLEAFQAEMTRPGGVFHKMCSELSDEDLADLSVGWVTDTLGRYEDVPVALRSHPLSVTLTTALSARSVKVVPPPVEPLVPSQRGPQVSAQFMCAYHGWGFVGMYPTKDRVPQHRACPKCGEPSKLIRMMATT